MKYNSMRYARIDRFGLSLSNPLRQIESRDILRLNNEAIFTRKNEVTFIEGSRQCTTLGSRIIKAQFGHEQRLEARALLLTRGHR